MPLANISFGSYTPDGIRSGPAYNDGASLLPTYTLSDGTVVTNSSVNNPYSSTYASFGPGVLYSPINTFKITPFSSTGAAGSICNQFNVTGSGNVPFNTAALIQNSCLTYLTDSNTLLGYMQLDWPRALNINTTSAGNIAAGTSVTVFGFDRYKNKFQKTVDISGASAGKSIRCAYSGITQVYVNVPGGGAPAQAFTIQIQATDAFGIPYVLKNVGGVVNYAWNNLSITPVVNTNVFTADLTPIATATTTDVRGLIAVPSASDGVKSLYFSFYVEGDDVFQNQENAFYLSAVEANNGNQTPGVWMVYDGTNRVPIPQLKWQDMFGVQQYYTGTPG